MVQSINVHQGWTNMAKKSKWEIEQEVAQQWYEEQVGETKAMVDILIRMEETKGWRRGYDLAMQKNSKDLAFIQALRNWVYDETKQEDY